MEEEIKKRGRGRPKKGEEAPKTTKKPKGQRGGKREGAGRKKGWTGQYKENPKNTMLTFRVSEATARRIKQLRELTKQDTMPFVDMLESWVAEMAGDYGIE